MPSAEDYRSFELEAAAATSVARGRTALGGLIKFGLPLGAVLVAAWMIWNAQRQRTSTMTTPDREEFVTTQFPAPSLSTPRTQTSQGTIHIPSAPIEPPPPPQPPQTIQPPPAPEPPLPAIPRNDDEARRQAELERQRLAEEERRKWERLRSTQVVSDHAGAGAGALNGEGERAGAATGPEEDANRRFLANVSNTNVDVSRATRNSRIDALIAQGTLIRGVLETALQSDLPGMVRAVVTEDVWSFDGRRVLIPQGSRLIGEYRSGLAQGQTQVFVVWSRLLRSDGVSVQLGSNGADELGRAGNTGFVDNHYAQRFGAAILLSVVSGAAQFLSSYGQNLSGGAGTTITTTDPVTGVVTQTQTGTNQNQLSLQARQIAAQNVAQTLTGIAQEALRNSVNIPPTIYLDQGTRITVFVRRDLDFAAFYPDPVKEALQEIKRERRVAK